MDEFEYGSGRPVYVYEFLYVGSYNNNLLKVGVLTESVLCFKLRNDEWADSITLCEGTIVDALIRCLQW
jgi:hypothetical protein